MTTKAPVVDEAFPRTYRTTVFLAALIGLWLFCVLGAQVGLNFACGAALGVLLLHLLERAVNASLGAPPGRARRRQRLIYGPLHVLKYGLVAAAFYYGFRLELIAPLPLAAGYTLAYAVLVWVLLRERRADARVGQAGPSA